MQKKDNYKQDPEWREMHKRRMRCKKQCEICGCSVQQYAILRHERTQKHHMLAKLRQLEAQQQSKTETPETHGMP